MPVLGQAPDAANALLALCNVAHGTVDVAEGSQALVTVGNQNLVSFPEGGTLVKFWIPMIARVTSILMNKTVKKRQQ